MLPTDGRSNQFEGERESFASPAPSCRGKDENVAQLVLLFCLLVQKRNAQSLRRRFRGAVSPVLYFRAANGTPPLARKRQPSIYRTRTRPIPPSVHFPPEGSPTKFWVSRSGGLPRFTLPSPEGCVTVALSGYSGLRESLSPPSGRIPAPPYGGPEHSGHRSPGEPGLSSTPRGARSSGCPHLGKKRKDPAPFFCPFVLGGRDFPLRQTRTRKGVGESAPRRVAVSLENPLRGRFPARRDVFWRRRGDSNPRGSRGP